jgi:hypothetical protein
MPGRKSIRHENISRGGSDFAGDESGGHENFVFGRGARIAHGSSAIRLAAKILVELRATGDSPDAIS